MPSVVILLINHTRYINMGRVNDAWWVDQDQDADWIEEMTPQIELSEEIFDTIPKRIINTNEEETRLQIQ